MLFVKKKNQKQDTHEGACEDEKKLRKPQWKLDARTPRNDLQSADWRSMHYGGM